MGVGGDFSAAIRCQSAKKRSPVYNWKKLKEKNRIILIYDVANILHSLKAKLGRYLDQPDNYTIENELNCHMNEIYHKNPFSHENNNGSYDLKILFVLDGDANVLKQNSDGEVRKKTREHNSNEAKKILKELKQNKTVNDLEYYKRKRFALKKHWAAASTLNSDFILSLVGKVILI